MGEIRKLYVGNVDPSTVALDDDSPAPEPGDEWQDDDGRRWVLEHGGRWSAPAKHPGDDEPPDPRKTAVALLLVADAAAQEAEVAQHSREVMEWAIAANNAIHAAASAQFAIPQEKLASPSAREVGLRHAITTYEDLLVDMARTFEVNGGESPVAQRLAARIRATLDGVQDGAPS